VERGRHLRKPERTHRSRFLIASMSPRGALVPACVDKFQIIKLAAPKTETPPRSLEDIIRAIASDEIEAATGARA